MEYTIYVNENGEKRVKFDNGQDYNVHTDSEGLEYFSIPNMSPKATLFLFSDCIKDGIEAIRKGDGDVLSINGVIGGRTESVYRFVDREIGERLRQKTIDGFKDAVFGFSLKFGYLNSFRGSMWIGEGGRQTLGFAFGEGVPHIFFETEEKAEAYKQELLDKAKSYHEKYKALESVPNSQADVGELLDEISDTVIIDMIVAFDSGDKWNLEVVQAIKPPAVAVS